MRRSNVLSLPLSVGGPCLAIFLTFRIRYLALKNLLKKKSLLSDQNKGTLIEGKTSMAVIKIGTF
jgi:hypothetical protein